MPTSTPAVDYSLRVAKLYPRECDDLVPFAGVPTEELARQASLRKDPSKRIAKHRPGSESHGVHSVLSVVHHPLEETTDTVRAHKRYIARDLTTTIPTATDADFSSLDAQPLRKAGLKLSHRGYTNATTDLLADDAGLTAATASNTERRFGKRRGQNHPGATCFTDIHNLQPVQHVNQRTFDCMPKGFNRGARRNCENANTDIFQCGLPRTREGGYKGCLETNKVSNPSVTSHLKVLDGYVVPSEDFQEKRGSKPANANLPGLEVHLTGGAIPTCDESDSFKTLRKYRKDSQYTQHYHELTARNQQELHDYTNHTENMPLRRQLAARLRSMRSPEVDPPTPSRRKHIQKDHVRELTMNWHRDQWVHSNCVPDAGVNNNSNGAASWLDIPEAQHGEECVGTYGALHDVELHDPALHEQRKNWVGSTRGNEAGNAIQVYGENPRSPCFGDGMENRCGIDNTEANEHGEDAELLTDANLDLGGEDDSDDKELVNVRYPAHILREADNANGFSRAGPLCNRNEPVSAHFRTRGIVPDAFVDTLKPAPGRLRPV